MKAHPSFVSKGSAVVDRQTASAVGPADVGSDVGATIEVAADSGNDVRADGGVQERFSGLEEEDDNVTHKLVQQGTTFDAQHFDFCLSFVPDVAFTLLRSAKLIALTTLCRHPAASQALCCDS